MGLKAGSGRKFCIRAKDDQFSRMFPMQSKLSIWDGNKTVVELPKFHEG